MGAPAPPWLQPWRDPESVTVTANERTLTLEGCETRAATSLKLAAEQELFATARILAGSMVWASARRMSRGRRPHASAASKFLWVSDVNQIAGCGLTGKLVGKLVFHTQRLKSLIENGSSCIVDLRSSLNELVQFSSSEERGGCVAPASSQPDARRRYGVAILLLRVEAQGRH